jgi:hypothetical protein
MSLAKQMVTSHHEHGLVEELHFSVKVFLVNARGTKCNNHKLVYENVQHDLELIVGLKQDY